MAQPFRAYAKTLLERQDYPGAAPRCPAAPPERPYDVAGWTLPLSDGRHGRRDRAVRSSCPAMSRVERGADATRRRWLGDRAAFAIIAIDARGNGGALAINRLQAAGAAVQWTLSAARRCGHDAIQRARSDRPGLDEDAVHVRRAPHARARTDRRRRARANCRAASRPVARAAHRALQAVGGEHRRGLDALAARAVRVLRSSP